MKLAEIIESGIQADKAHLKLVKSLPEENLKELSERFTHQDAFGLEFLDDVAWAKYSVGGKGWDGFITSCDDEEAAKNILKQYAGHLGNYGNVVLIEDSRLVGEMYDKFTIVKQVGSRLIGATHAENRDDAEKWVEQWAKKIQKKK
jgi:hypothetical protein